MKILRILICSAFLILLICPVMGQIDYYHFDSKLAEKLMFSALNRIRLENHLPLLSRNSDLAKVANRHTRDIIKRNFFDHINPDGDGPRERVRQENIPYPVSENLGILSSYGLEVNEVVEELLKSLMESPEHRVNILNPNLSEIGISFAQDWDQVMNIIDMDVIGDSKLGYGTVIVCQLFMKKGLVSLHPDPFPSSFHKGDSTTITGLTYRAFDTVSIEIQESGGGRIIRSSEIALFDNEFTEELKFNRNGEYELRIRGITYNDQGMSSDEELATFKITVEG